MSAVQPDLFGEFDAAAERKAQREAEEVAWREPATCPCCGTTEPNGFLLLNNHHYRPGQPKQHHGVYGEGYCVAMYLTRNHIWYSARHDEAESLADAMKRGRELGMDVEAVLASVKDKPTGTVTYDQEAS